MTSTSCVITWEMTGRAGAFASPPSSKNYPSSRGRSRRSRPEKPGNPQRKPGAEAPAAGARPGPARIPLSRTAENGMRSPESTNARRESAGCYRFRCRAGGRFISRGESPNRHWLREPKTAVWIILAAALVFGGWHKLRLAWRARKAVARLEDPKVTPQEVEAAAEHGRAAVWELLRIFSSSTAEPLRQAAGRALARLWFLDQLVAEEEQAIVRRGFTVNWNARRRYPRALRAADSDLRELRRSLSGRRGRAGSTRGTWNGRIAWSVPGARHSKSFHPGWAGAGTLHSPSCRATSRRTARIAWSCRPGCERRA